MQVKKVVLTGGPCAGKSTALRWIHDIFENKDCKVIFIPETASELIQNGITPWEASALKEFQNLLLRRQLEKEADYEASIKFLNRDKYLFIYDRGALDGHAYLSNEDWQYCLDDNQITEKDALGRYDACIHLTTAAKGAEEHYTLGENIRTETIEEARDLDDRTLAAWQEHKNHKIIDNSTDFDGKMQRLIEEINKVLAEA